MIYGLLLNDNNVSIMIFVFEILPIIQSMGQWSYFSVIPQIHIVPFTAEIQ